MEHVDPGDPIGIATDLKARFSLTHGHPPVGVFAAPGRVNLIGEHTDYNDGLCLPVALPYASYAAAAARPDGLLTMSSRQQSSAFSCPLSDLAPGRVDGWPAYVAGVAWALIDAGISLPGMDVMIDGRVPLGAGLSSSAALECSVALAMCAVAGIEVDDDVRRLLVRACIRAETDMAGAPTGGMDQTISFFAQESHALLLDCHDGRIQHVPWDPARAGLQLVVIDTRTQHALVDGAYANRRADCHAAAGTLGVPALRGIRDRADLAALPARQRRRATHVVSEIHRVERAVEAIGSGDLLALGKLFCASHRSLRDDFEVSCPSLDLAVDAAMAAGAVGARMTGGGFGGSAIALVPTRSVPGVTTSVHQAFVAKGWTAPRFLIGTSQDGAAAVEMDASG